MKASSIFFIAVLLMAVALSYTSISMIVEFFDSLKQQLPPTALDAQKMIDRAKDLATATVLLLLVVGVASIAIYVRLQ